MASRILMLYLPISRAFAVHQRHLDSNLRATGFARETPGAKRLKGDRLLSTSHVARHCRKNDLRLNPISLAPDGILECALIPHPDGLSTTWLEFFRGDRTHNVTMVRHVIGLTPDRVIVLPFSTSVILTVP